MTRILFIMPDAHMHKLKLFGFTKSLREAPLTLTTLASMVPSGHHITIVDGSIDPIPMDYKADIVAISCITGTCRQGYVLADHFRHKGSYVVIGGVHASILPDEAQEHADTVIVGPAEFSWPTFLTDYSSEKQKKRYGSIDCYHDDVLRDVPLPRRDLQRNSGYTLPATVQATRGCKHRCDFCCVNAVWPRFVKRPIADVIRDISSLPGKRMVFNDVSLVDDVEYAKELFRAMIPLRKHWGGLATVLVVKDDELVDLMMRSGCKYLLLGFESGNQGVLKDIAKGFNHAINYHEVVDKLHAHDITIQGCFVFGFDHDTEDVFESTVATVDDLGIDIPRYSIYTPYPGTPLFERLQSEGRIISLNWNNYDTMHVVFQPKLMTPERLYDGFKWSYKQTFKIPRIARRTMWNGRHPSVINFVGNLAYRIFVRRLYREERFARPFMP
ncbi:MAG: radical SAM protein [bacterium]|nr:radical SAM protein [bacterium]